MNSFATEITINASSERVWNTLSNIGTIYQWNPGVIDSRTTSEIGEGLGATRFCDLGGKNFLDEEVVAWRPLEQLTMRITNTNLPFKTADIRFYLRPEKGQTVVTVSPQYELKFGPLGRLLDKVYVQKSYQKGMQSLLQGLKKHIETKQ